MKGHSNTISMASDLQDFYIIIQTKFLIIWEALGGVGLISLLLVSFIVVTPMLGVTM